MADLKSKNGFTLIEVMIALSVLMIGLVGIIGVQIAGIHQLAQAKHRTTASQLAAQMLEYFKNAPVDNGCASCSPDPIPANPAKIFTDALSGKTLVDADGGALLNDTTMGDGYLTWHRLPPMRADGTMLPFGGNWKSEYFYMAIYGVEWGGWNGSVNIPTIETAELDLAKYPETIPGVNEIYIEVWVFWVEPGQRLDEYKGTKLPNIMSYYDPISSDFKLGKPSISPRRKIVLKTIRKI